MQIFSCHRCHQVLFFENVNCTRCGVPLAYLPDLSIVSGVIAAEAPIWTAAAPAAAGARYRLCRNYREHNVCNWAIPADDDADYCRACRLNEVIPNLDDAGARIGWQRLEAGKRRLIYSLLDLGLPLETRAEHPRGLAFQFLKDGNGAADKVITGHRDGVVTLNVAEADDPFREKMRVSLGETYRTILGHFRHEVGHYYWYRLVEESATWLPAFRARFGDERADYAAAVERHYQGGPPGDWQSHFVSPYASMHPWEDWAETWAHYLHMVDTLDTARAYGLSLRATPANGDIVPLKVKTRRIDLHSFEDLMEGWVPLTLALNSLNRSMGTADPYPFVLSTDAIAKLSLVHTLIEAVATAAAEPARQAG